MGSSWRDQISLSGRKMEDLSRLSKGGDGESRVGEKGVFEGSHGISAIRQSFRPRKALQNSPWDCRVFFFFTTAVGDWG